MGRALKVDELRELLKLAKQLRDSAACTDDKDYIDMFLRAAMALEERAHAGCTDQIGSSGLEVRAPVDMIA